MVDGLHAKFQSQRPGLDSRQGNPYWMTTKRAFNRCSFAKRTLKYYLKSIVRVHECKCYKCWFILESSTQFQSTSVTQTFTSTPKKVSFAQDGNSFQLPGNFMKKTKSKRIIKSKHVSENYSYDSEPCQSSVFERGDFGMHQTSMTVSSISNDSSM